VGPPANDLTIDELARRAGMTVRNIRAHQARGLLAPPEVRGRTGFYGADHLARLELVKELQADGFNLAAIGRLLAHADGTGEQVLRFTRAARAAFDEERPEVTTAEDLATTFGGGERAARAAVRLGLLRPLGDGAFEVPSPRLLAAGSELAALGVPAGRALALVARVRRHADRIAAAFVELFVAEVWEPFDAAGRPPERWPEVRDAVERLRPLAGDALGAVFALAMRDAVEEAFGRVLRERPARGARGGGRSRRRRA
jgi:DNA-binding transcriptional MerR regulator